MHVILRKLIFRLVLKSVAGSGFHHTGKSTSPSRHFAPSRRDRDLLEGSRLSHNTKIGPQGFQNIQICVMSFCAPNPSMYLYRFNFGGLRTSCSICFNELISNIYPLKLTPVASTQNQQWWVGLKILYFQGIKSQL